MQKIKIFLKFISKGNAKIHVGKFEKVKKEQRNNI